MDENKPLAATPFIAICDLCKSFDNGSARIEILNNANFEIVHNETIAIVGASGIGKSTFLHILGTLDRPDSGNVLFEGQDVFKFDNSKLAGFRNESIGFVFQFHYLLPEFSALENGMMPALVKGMSKTVASEAAEEILVRVGLKERLSHRVTDLSGGEQQRVALARALVLKPKVLLADEPTGNLDRKNSEQVHDLLMELNTEFGMALVVVTHSEELANFMSRRVTLTDGKLIEIKLDGEKK
ncbi:ABC transporter ATP-binding protein [Desulfobacterales bacterium HSG16]|nr:ABC transporter ATP-binding protein [Desulfobacterales bacterium HSG16]